MGWDTIMLSSVVCKCIYYFVCSYDMHVLILSIRTAAHVLSTCVWRLHVCV